MDVFIPKYFRCDDCDQIEIELVWEQQSKYQHNCPHCHNAGRHSIWPDLELRNLFEFIAQYDVRSSNFPQVSCVFLSSALELMLENLLSIMAFQDMLYEEVSMLIDALLEGYQGRARMFNLFSKIGYSTFHEAVNQIGKKRFIKNWDTVVEARNNVVHGRISDCKKITPTLIEQTIVDALDVFSNINNQYNKESLRYRIATKSIK